jgi:hypothetical protein
LKSIHWERIRIAMLESRYVFNGTLCLKNNLNSLAQFSLETKANFVSLEIFPQTQRFSRHPPEDE